MPLHDLVQVIETIQQRIRDHGDTLRQNETRTRMALIDPLLTALGWDVADPGLVVAEVMEEHPVEYMLMEPNGGALVSIVTRGLGDDAEPHRRQLLDWFHESHDLYLCFTDGNQWEVYDAIRPVSPRPNRVFSISLSDDATEHCSENVVRLSLSELGWIGLPLVIGDPTHTRHPSAVRFSDGKKETIENWYDVVVATSRWLWEKGLMTRSNFPVKSGYKNDIVNTEPYHRDGTPFSQPIGVSGSQFFVETKVSSKAVIANTKKLLTHCGVNLGSVDLNFR